MDIFQQQNIDVNTPIISALAQSTNAVIRLALAVCCTLPVMVSAATSQATVNAEAKVERTSHGIVHVTAQDYRGIGYGVGYAYTEDNRCVLAHRIAQVNGRLAEQTGPYAISRMLANGHIMSALLSDAFYQAYFDTEAIRAGFATEPQSIKDLAEGYVAGINKYLADHPNLSACQSVNFTGKVTVDDLYRMWMATTGLASAEFVGPFLAITETTSQSVPAAPTSKAASLSTTNQPKEQQFGSNAWAIGRDAVQKGSGPLHFYNPHFPWEGIQRTYIVHVRIPGELDVMGPTLGGFPLPVSGFNKTMAWGLTFSNTQRVTLMEIQPRLEDPNTYLLDGQIRQIKSTTYPIAVANEAVPRNVVVQSTDDGPIIWGATLGLPTGNAFVVRDVNLTNYRFLRQALEVAKSKTVVEVQDKLKTVKGTPWSYTTAVDSKGETLFGDLSPMPNVTNEHYLLCGNNPSSLFLAFIGVVSLDGTRSECYWQGTLSAELLPSVIRSDYVANSNNNQELPNVNARLIGAAPILGLPGTPLGLRPSLGLQMIEQRLNGTDGLGAPGFSFKLLKKVFNNKRNYGAELLVTDIANLCLANPTILHNGVNVDLRPICKALADWDRKNAKTSRGAHVFTGMMYALQELGVFPQFLFAVPASLDEPLTTPQGLTTDATIRTAILSSLARVSVALKSAGISPKARWGDVHFVVGAHGKRYGLPGGPGNQGVFDAMQSLSILSFEAWIQSLKGLVANDLSGSSYIHFVEFGRQGPTAHGLLAFSQASEASSPWYQDQLKKFSDGSYYKFPFTQSEIKSNLKSSLNLK